MKKLDKRLLKPCALEPVEKKSHVKLPGVPEHFNYGIFFDDDYDYMQHLKEASEFNERTAYRITGIPEDEVLETDETEPISERPREPEADPRDMVVEGLGLDSDEEIEETSEIEDNFVELAGGHVLEDEDTDEAAEEISDSGELSQPKLANPREVLAQDKVLMMERFLYGDNERDWAREHESGNQDDSDDEQFDDPDEATVLNRQFEKLMLRCKNRAGSASQSMVTGSSMMSEGLQYALQRDSRMLQHQKIKSDELDELESDVRAKTLACAEQALSNPPAESLDSQSEDEQSEEFKPDINTVCSEADTSMSKPNFSVLAVPPNPKTAAQRSRQVSMESLARAGQTPAVVTLRSTELDPSLFVRHRGETAEEKQRRKLAVKQHRQERRQIRKANQANFRAEHERQMKSNMKTLTIT